MVKVDLKAAFEALEAQVSRRRFLGTIVKVGSLGLTLDRLGSRLSAADTVRKADSRLPYQVYSAIGELVIPVDDDPGWTTFEPGITEFGMDVFVKQVLLNGNPLAFGGFLATMSILNDAPRIADYGPEFLTMNHVERTRFFGDVLTGQFENDGLGDPLGFASGLSLISTKAAFFSNYPNHRAVPGAEFQVRSRLNVKTGWDIMGLRGPVGPEEERQLRAKYFDAEELPGVDPTNKWI